MLYYMSIRAATRAREQAIRFCECVISYQLLSKYVIALVCRVYYYSSLITQVFQVKLLD